MGPRRYIRSYEKFIIASFVFFALLITYISYITSFNPYNFREETLLFLDNVSSNLLSPLSLAFLFFLLADFFNKYQAQNS